MHDIFADILCSIVLPTLLGLLRGFGRKSSVHLLPVLFTKELESKLETASSSGSDQTTLIRHDNCCINESLVITSGQTSCKEPSKTGTKIYWTQACDRRNRTSGLCGFLWYPDVRFFVVAQILLMIGGGLLCNSTI